MAVRINPLKSDSELKRLQTILEFRKSPFTIEVSNIIGDVMKSKILVSTIFIFVTIFASNALAQNSDMELVFGFGLAAHTFSETDAFREPTGPYGDSDEITVAVGLQAYLEYFVMDFISAGFKVQALEGGHDYGGYGYTIERRIGLENQLGYINILPAIGDGYWRLGGTVGYGSSTYIVKWTLECESYSTNCTNQETSESSSGTIMEAGFIADWGEDGFGGRFGYLINSTNHDDIEDVEVKGSGTQLFLDVRYAF